MSADPEQDIGYLNELQRHPGFALLCARFEDKLTSQREACLDEENDIEAAKLRRAYQVVKTFSPKVECERLIAQARRAIAKDSSSTDGR